MMLTSTTLKFVSATSQKVSLVLDLQASQGEESCQDYLLLESGTKAP